jgi:hypothetical protein
MTDIQIWNQIPQDKKWVFNKLEVALRAGLVCGLREIPVPQEGEYVVRPVYNLSGMGLDAKVMHLTPETTEYEVPTGHFWCEKLVGIHKSVDYKSRKPVLAVRGSHTQAMWKWSVWEKISLGEAPPLPRFLDDLSLEYPLINVEYIGNIPIEVHLRGNPDFKDGQSVLVPVWEGDSTVPPKGFTFVSSPEVVGKYIYRKGFFTQ